MTRRNSLQTIHEPFGDAYYYGPERMGSRFEEDEQAREESGFATSTFKTILDRIEHEGEEVRLPSRLTRTHTHTYSFYRASASSSKTSHTTSSRRRRSPPNAPLHYSTTPSEASALLSVATRAMR